MKSALIAVSCAALLAIAASWPLAPEITGYTSRTVYNGFQPMQTYTVEYAVPFGAQPAANLRGYTNTAYRAPPAANVPLYNNDYRAPEGSSRQKRQLGLGAGMGGSSAQAQAQSQSSGMGMGMGGMGGFGMGYPGFGMMGYPFGMMG